MMPKQFSGWNFHSQTENQLFWTQGFEIITHWGPSCTKGKHWAQVGGSFLCRKSSSVFWKNFEMRNMKKCPKPRLMLIPAAAQPQTAKIKIYWPGWFRAGKKLHGSRSSEGKWLKFCREKREKKIMWNKTMLGMWSDEDEGWNTRVIWTGTHWG